MTTERVVVLVDYENMHRCAQNELGVSNGHFWPWLLGDASWIDGTRDQASAHAS